MTSVSPLRVFQVFAIAANKLIRSSGLLRTKIGQTAYLSLYLLYKRHLEAGPIKPLKQLIRPGGSVVDIGAHVGFFTLQFADWVSDGGRVIAVEPDPRNLEVLRQRIASSPNRQSLVLLEAVASNSIGSARILFDETNTADNRLDPDGQSITSVTLDSIVAENTISRLDLVKVDVQGAEIDVIAGAESTLRNQRPAFFVEFEYPDEPGKQASLQSCIDSIFGFGYSFHSLHRDGYSAPIQRSEVLDMIRREDYLDFLLLPSEGPDAPDRAARDGPHST